MLHGAHYGGGTLSFSQNESWTKVYGPFMLYVNTDSDAEALWEDAKAKGAVEQAAFP